MKVCMQIWDGNWSKTDDDAVEGITTSTWGPFQVFEVRDDFEAGEPDRDAPNAMDWYIARVRELLELARDPACLANRAIHGCDIY